MGAVDDDDAAVLLLPLLLEGLVPGACIVRVVDDEDVLVSVPALVDDDPTFPVVVASVATVVEEDAPVCTGVDKKNFQSSHDMAAKPNMVQKRYVLLDSALMSLISLLLFYLLCEG